MPTLVMKVNGTGVSHDVPANTLLVSFLRETLGLTGAHVGLVRPFSGAFE